MKKIRRTASGAVATGVILALGAGVAMAGTTYTAYDVVVPPLGGVAYTGSQTKAASGVAGDLKSVSVGGSYTLTAWMQTTSGQDQQQVSYVGDNTTYKLPNNVAKGTAVRVKLKNGLITVVNVEARGQWRSN